MKDLSAPRASRLLHQLIAEGEHESQDFKYTVNDPRKIARSISAFANNKGGRLLIGVDDNGSIKGVRTEEDIYVVEAAASIYCTPTCRLEINAYKEKGGAIVIRAEIPFASNRPIFVKEKDNQLKAYYRVADENIVAHPLMLKYWKRQSKSYGSIILDSEDAHTAILNLLKEKPLAPEDFFKKLSFPKYKIEEAIVNLAQMKLVDFVFIDRAFHLQLNEI